MSDQRERSPEDGSFVERALERLLPDLIARSVASGIKSVFSSRDGIRRVAENVPKELAGFLGEQLVGLRGDIFRVLSTELRAFFDRVNLGQEIQRALTALSLQITMEVRFLPSDRGLKPQVTTRVRSKVTEPGVPDDTEPPADDQGSNEM